MRLERGRIQGVSGLYEIYVMDIELNLKTPKAHWSGEVGIRDGGTDSPSSKRLHQGPKVKLRRNPSALGQFH